jgi:hypothetical protein
MSFFNFIIRFRVSEFPYLKGCLVCGKFAPQQQILLAFLFSLSSISSVCFMILFQFHSQFLPYFMISYSDFVFGNVIVCSGSQTKRVQREI